MEQSISGNKNSLKKQAREAPPGAGVYIMKDSNGRIIYVGKARILRNRLSSYFSGEKDIKTATLVRRVASFETISTADEYEALLLENTLIKQHSPRYNLKLTDGKTYPVIRLCRPPYPRVFLTRHIVEDGSCYFGPFPNVGVVEDMLDIIDRNFPLRKCRTLKKRTSPCMYYHIDRCAAPCCGKITETEYAIHVERVRKLLSGETAPLTAELDKAMKAEAAALRFERAAHFRNAVRAIEDLSGTSTVVDFDSRGRDYIAWAEEGVLATWAVFSMRQGKLTGRELFSTRSASDEAESLETFIASYYNASRPPPPQIFVYDSGEDAPRTAAAEQLAAMPGIADRPGCRNRLQRWFRETFDTESDLIFCGTDADAEGEAKHHQAILAMVRQNAAEDIRRRLRERGAGPALDELAAALVLRSRPETIEGFDIAQLDGKHPVASLIRFKDGIPDRKNYRHFKLRSVIGIVDDFASVREAVERRYSRLIRENSELPDLILIDGGIGQVNAAKGVLDKLGITCDIAGLAKREEELWLPGASDPIRLSRSSEALRILQHVRDETHRFATGLNQKLRSKDLRLETLESIHGIGKVRAAKLIKTFGGIDKIAEASAEDIAACGISLSAAKGARAAAALSLEERKRQIGKTAYRSGSASKLAAAALADSTEAAEPETEYD